MKGLDRAKTLMIAEQAVEGEVGLHSHGKHTKIFLNGLTITTMTKNVITSASVSGGVLTKTEETITYVTDVSFTTDRAVVDILTQADLDVNE